MLIFDGRAILCDIEGTTSSIRFVYDVLFPFARRHAEMTLREQWDTPQLAEALDLMARDAGFASRDAWLGSGFSDSSVRAVLTEIGRLMDADAKATGLKALQGVIWARGYASGELKSHVYDDVPPAFGQWHARGIDVRIYSSGAAAAQRLFFRHTTAGDLTPFLRGHYDTTVGPKRSPDSYRVIAREFQASAADILFLSDIPAELDAASSAGLRTALLVRPGNAPVDDTPHPRLSSFAEIV